MVTHIPLAAVIAVAAVILAVGFRLWPALRPPVPIEVLSPDWRRRLRVRRQLGAAMHRLCRLAGRVEVVLLAVEALPQQQRATCSPVRRRADGSTPQLISLALTIEGRRLTSDEVLAALASQYLALALASTRPRVKAPAAGPSAGPAALQELLADLGAARDGTVRP